MNFEDQWFYIAGVANKKSVATYVAKELKERGAKLIFSGQNETNLKKINSLFPDCPAFILDVSSEEDIKLLPQKIRPHTDKLQGFLHSLAFARFSMEHPAFHETPRENFLEATQISCFSWVEISNALKELLLPNASSVSVSISNTKATSYGFLGPIKAMLSATAPYLAKSFSSFSNVRFNTVAAGPLKTSASAGIPDYVDNYLYSEALTLRKEALQTQEVAKAILFLLSDFSSGINAENIVIDAGINANYFDQEIVKAFHSKN